jgi:hypothetical protein
MQLKFQETEKDFNNAMGQESLTVLTNPKKKKPNKTKPAGEKQTGGDNKIIAKQKSQQTMAHHLQAKKPAITRKPIIITKNEAKNSIFSF